VFRHALKKLRNNFEVENYTKLTVKQLRNFCVYIKNIYVIIEFTTFETPGFTL
jgi:hypothetical protein